MLEFNSRSELNNYIYGLFCGLTDSRQFLSKKMEKKLDADLQKEYELSDKLMTFNQKYILRMKFRELYLERKMMRKNFRNYKKNFGIEYKKIKPKVEVDISKKSVKLSDGKLPKLIYTSEVEGSIDWFAYVLQSGVHEYEWIFYPKDKDKYTSVTGIFYIGVIDDLAIRQEE